MRPRSAGVPPNALPPCLIIEPWHPTVHRRASRPDSGLPVEDGQAQDRDKAAPAILAVVSVTGSQPDLMIDPIEIIVSAPEADGPVHMMFCGHYFPPEY